MQQILRLDNAIQHYAWGSRRYIPALMGRRTPSDQPEAELWMGAHPKAPSTADGHDLATLIAEQPEAMLGKATVERFGPRLPFLFKLLAAETPLSIQAHPNREQAREGYARENERGIALNARERNYKDDNHKPELLCALSEFWALNGFRPIDELMALLEELGVSTMRPALEMLQQRPDRDGLAEVFRWLQGLNADRREALLGELVQVAAERRSERPEHDWLLRVADLYPGDLGAVCVLLLNLVKLQPGEAIFCAAGDLHAYLQGFGVELMANSDNVLRGGLTGKHVDVDELMRILTFSARPPEILRAHGGDYPAPVDEFALRRIAVDPDRTYQSPRDRGLEILINVGGWARIGNLGDEPLSLEPGQSVVVPAAVPGYRITGEATLYRAAIGHALGF